MHSFSPPSPRQFQKSTAPRPVLRIIKNMNARLNCVPSNIFQNTSRLHVFKRTQRAGGQVERIGVPVIAVAVGEERVTCFAGLQADGALVADRHVTRLHVLVHTGRSEKNR